MVVTVEAIRIGRFSKSVKGENTGTNLHKGAGRRICSKMDMN